MIQLQALNYILDTKDASFILTNNLNKDFFCDYSTEFVWIWDHYTQYNCIPDKESFLAQFPNFDIVEVNETPQYLSAALFEDKNRRLLAVTFNKVRELLTDNKTDDALKLFMTAAEDISEEIKIDCVDILKDTSRYDAYVERCKDYNKFYVTTGFKELDDVLGGWDRQEELVTIVARTNAGKSWILIKSAVEAAEAGLRVGLYSGEMSDRKVGYRADTLIAHISNSGMLHGNVAIQNDYKRYIDKIQSGEIKGTLKVLTPAMISGGAGVMALRAFIEKEKLDILFVDQHSLLEDDRNAKNPVERAANISKDLKNLQVIKKLPIITVSQQNRTSTDGGVNTTHIAQSDRIGQDSTIVIFFEQKDGVLTLSLVKSRDTANGKKLQYAIDFDKGIFTYIPSETDAKDGKDCDKLHADFDMGDDKPF